MGTALHKRAEHKFHVSLQHLLGRGASLPMVKEGKGGRTATCWDEDAQKGLPDQNGVIRAGL